MKGFRLPILIAIVVILALTVAAANPADFEASGPESVAVCGCDTQTRDIIVINSGLFTSFYDVEQTGTLTEVVPSQFVLQPQESIVLTEIINAPCSKQLTETVKTTITNDLNIKKSFEQNIRVGMCENAAVTASPIITTGCRCSEFYYQVEVRNIDGFTDTYTLFSDQPDITTIAPRQFRLSPGETAAAYVTINPSCDVKGNNDVEILAQSFNGADSATTTLGYHADPICYAYPQPSQDNGSILIWLIPLLPLVLIVLLIIIAMVTLANRTPPRHAATIREAKVEKHAEDNFWWESKFPEEQKEPQDHTVLFVILGIILMLSLIFLTSLYIVQNIDLSTNQTAVNETMNETIDVDPVIEPVNDTETNETGTEVKEAKLPPGIAPLLWLILVILIILAILSYIKYRPQSEKPKEKKKEEKPKKEKPKKETKKPAKKEAKKAREIKLNPLFWKIPFAIVALIILVVVWIFRAPILDTLKAYNLWTFWILIGLLVVGTVLKLYFISKKPAHHDDPKTSIWPLINTIIVAAILFVVSLFFLRTQVTLSFYIVLGLSALAVVLVILRLRK